MTCMFSLVWTHTRKKLKKRLFKTTLVTARLNSTHFSSKIHNLQVSKGNFISSCSADPVVIVKCFSPVMHEHLQACSNLSCLPQAWGSPLPGDFPQLTFLHTSRGASPTAPLRDPFNLCSEICPSCFTLGTAFKSQKRLSNWVSVHCGKCCRSGCVQRAAFVAL